MQTAQLSIMPQSRLFFTRSWFPAPRFWETMTETAFPPLSNSLIAMVKDTSLAANITVTEMFMVTQRIASRYYEHLALYIEVALIYLLFCTVLTRLQSWGEKKLSSYGAV